MSTTTPQPIQNHPPSERLIRALEAHAAAESHDVASYRELTSRSADPVLGLLVEMIVADDQRHQALVQAMLQGLGANPDSVAPPSALATASDAPAADTEVAASVRALIRDEHESARHLRHLARQEPGLYSGLFPLLLETMARDGEKHALILRFLLRRYEERAPGGA